MGLFPAVPTLNAELTAWRRGYRRVAGVDEVGCGPLAGPLLAAAVVLDPGAARAWWSELRDSKQLESEERERLSSLIRGDCEFGIGEASPEFIDEHGLTAARQHAMRAAIAGLRQQPQMVLVDGFALPEFRHRAIIHGDALVASIAAASIVAKVARDALMSAEHEAYPQYGFDSHKGYSTPEHKRALEDHGPCPIHRRLFAPVRAALMARGLPVPITASVGQAAEFAALA
jgi:ribonuclease HII